VRGSLTNNGTLAIGTNGIGTLTVSNALALNPGGTTTLAIDRTAGTATYGKAAGATSATFGGTLTVTSLGGTFQAGDTFTLFSAAGYSGNFAATNLPALSGLNWSWNPAAGTLAVVSPVNLTPTNISFSLSGSELTLSWPVSHTGWTLQAQTNSLSTGLSGTWFDITSSITTNSVTVNVDPAQPTVFYRLFHP
jgi:hypothetical protein